MLVLVTYDVSVDTTGGQKRLRRVAKCCTDFGIRVQNSVFECIVNEEQFIRLRHGILKEIDQNKDSIRFYRLGNNYLEKVEFYGVKPVIDVEKPLIL